MTTIAAITKDGVHAMAADGRCSAGDLITSGRFPKLHCHASGVVTAHAGSARTNDLVRLIGPSCDLATADSMARFLDSIFLDNQYREDSEPEPEPGPRSYRQEHFHLGEAGISEIGQDLAVTSPVALRRCCLPRRRLG